MKKFLAIFLSFIMLLSFCSCDKEEITTLKEGDVVEMKATKDGVDEFYKALKEELKDKDSEISSIYDDEYTEFNKANFYNITPENSEEKTGYKVFKDIECTSAFLYNGKEILVLRYGGVIGLETLSVADLNNDGYYEYICLGHYGSGVNGHDIDLFDLKTKEGKMLISSHMWNFNIRISDCPTDDKCYIYSADVEGDEANAKFTIKEKIAEIKYSSEEGFYFEPLVENITTNY